MRYVKIMLEKIWRINWHHLDLSSGVHTNKKENVFNGKIHSTFAFMLSFFLFSFFCRLCNNKITRFNMMYKNEPRMSIRYRSTWSGNNVCISLKYQLNKRENTTGIMKSYWTTDPLTSYLQISRELESIAENGGEE